MTQPAETNKTLFSDCIVIVRSVQERTEKLCMQLILEQGVPGDQVRVVRETPFSAAMKKSFRLGIESGLKWTCCIDADVLLKPGALVGLLQKAEEQPGNVCLVQGLVLDKFIQVKRPAGNHVYRSSLLEKAIRSIPEEGSSLRPESDMLSVMSKQGHPWVQCDVVAGIHDFEQYYGDIYRKCFLQAHKHAYLIPVLEPYWLEKSREDPDFEVAVMALRSGKVYGEQVLVDKNFLQNEAGDVLKMKRIKEKGGTVAPVPVSEIICEIERGPFLTNYQEQIFPADRWNWTHDLHKIAQAAENESRLRKALRAFTHRAGSLMEHAGRRLKTIMED